MATRSNASRIKIAAGACIAFVLVFTLYARFAVDYAALTAAHDSRLLGELLRHSVNVESISAKLAKFHQGPPPCEYAPMQDVPQDEVDVIARDLRGAKMLGHTRGLAPLFFKWGKDDEARRHGPRSDEEILVAWNATGSLYERAVAKVAAHGVADAIRATADRTQAQIATKADEAKRDLTEHEVEALYGIWVRHPVALSAPAFVQTLSRLPQE